MVRLLVIRYWLKLAKMVRILNVRFGPICPKSKQNRFRTSFVFKNMMPNLFGTSFVFKNTMYLRTNTSKKLNKTGLEPVLFGFWKFGTGSNHNFRSDFRHKFLSDPNDLTTEPLWSVRNPNYCYESVSGLMNSPHP